MMLDHSKWRGVVFILDKEGQVFRSDVHMSGRQSSVLGIFELKIDPRRAREGSQLIQLAGSSKDLTGTAKTITREKETKLDAAFHASLK